MANDRKPSMDQVLHDLAVANDAGEHPGPGREEERPPGLHRRESYDDLDTGPREDPEPEDGPPDEPPPS